MLDPLHQYNIYRCDRSDRTGGGVCAMVPASIKSNEHQLNDEERNYSWAVDVKLCASIHS